MLRRQPVTPRCPAHQVHVSASDLGSAKTASPAREPLDLTSDRSTGRCAVTGVVGRCRGSVSPDQFGQPWRAGSTTDTYRILIKSGLVDAWWTNLGRPGFTCCRNETLTNSELNERVDVVLTRWALPIGAQRVGVTPFQTDPPLWASDHAGVVADVLVF